MANNVNCEEMRFVIRYLVEVEDPPRQRRQKFLLMLLEATSVFSQKRNGLCSTAAVGISLRYETKVIEPVGEPSNIA